MKQQVLQAPELPGNSASNNRKPFISIKEILKVIPFLIMLFTINQSLADNPGNCSTQATTSSGHTVKFIGVEYSQGPNGCQSTWTYEVKGSNSGPAISHIVFGGLECLACLNNEDDILDATVSGINNPAIEIGEDGSTPYCGIKYDDGWDESETRTLTFTMDGAYAVGTVVFVAKAGPGYTTTEICGPVCISPVCEGGIWNEATCGCEKQCTIELSGVDVNSTCYDADNGTIDLTVSGAHGAVSYLWNDGATTEDRTGLAPGSYSVTVTDDEGCEATTSFTISEPAILNVTGVEIDEMTAIGSDGSIDITVTGGTAPYSYLWSDGSTDEDRTNLAAGNYSVTVTDNNGCNTSASFEIEEYVCTITVDAGPDTDKCHNEPTMLSASSSDPNASFSWEPASALDNANIANPVTNVFTTTTFTVTATGTDGCMATDEVTVTAYALVKASISIKPNTNACAAPCVKLFTKNNPNYTYEWRLNGLPIIGAVDKNTYCACESGDYSVHVTDVTSGCAHTSKKFAVNIAPKLESGDVNIPMSFTASPNPTSDVVNITVHNAQQGIVTIQLMDMLGRVVATTYTGSLQNEQTISFSMNGLSNGVYLVKIESSNFKDVQKVMLNK